MLKSSLSPQIFLCLLDSSFFTIWIMDTSASPTPLLSAVMPFLSLMSRCWSSPLGFTPLFFRPQKSTPHPVAMASPAYSHLFPPGSAFTLLMKCCNNFGIGKLDLMAVQIFLYAWKSSQYYLILWDKSISQNFFF